MTSDYSKKKNAELEELLKSRSLPHTGKKADLIARLQHDDAQQASSTKEPPASTDAGGEDEIDWDDDAAIVPTEGSNPPATAVIAAGGQGQVANPAAVPNQVTDTDPSKTKDLTTKQPAPSSATVDKAAEKSVNGGLEPDEKPLARPATNFTSGLSSTSIDEEIAKRQKRAARFNIKEGSDDALKALERARKFGTGTEGDKTAVRGLDEALPERVKRDRGIKRGREETNEAKRDMKRRHSGKRNSGRQARSRSRSQPRGGKQTLSGGRPERSDKARNEQSEKDRLAADARKKRFAESS